MSILIKPWVTEKVTAINDKGKYGFVVDKSANKIQIKIAIQKAYGVTVESVCTMIANGKAKSKNTKSKVVSGRTSAYKKAIVTVAKGEVIDFYSSI